MHKTNSRAFFLAPVIDIEVVEINTMFLTSKILGTCPNNVHLYCSCNM